MRAIAQVLRGMRVWWRGKGAVGTRRMSRLLKGWWLSSLLVLAASSPLLSERLPLRSFSTADGLAHNYVTAISADPLGYVWISTVGGLSRFDGYALKTYGIEHGLPEGSVNGLLVTRAGLYCVATSKGLYVHSVSKTPADSESTHPERMEPFFVRALTLGFGPVEVVDMVEDAAGVVWCGAGEGLFRLDRGRRGWEMRPVSISIAPTPFGERGVTALAADQKGGLWVGAMSGLYLRTPDGRTRRYTVKDRLPAGIRSIRADREGRIWAATPRGVTVLEPHGREFEVVRTYGIADGLPSEDTMTLCESREGEIWVGTVQGLAVLGGGEKRFTGYRRSNGLSDHTITALAEDRAGDMWIGTESAGVMRMARNGLITYGADDGLSGDRIGALLQTHSGDLCVVADQMMIHRFAAGRFERLDLKPPREVTGFGWGWNQIVAEDTDDSFWIATANGVLRMKGGHTPLTLTSSRNAILYDSHSGLSGDEVFRVYADSRGDVWVSTMSPTGVFLSRWVRADGALRRYGGPDGLPAAAPTCFAEDLSGAVWIGFYTGGLARFAHGRFESLSERSRVPAGLVRALYLDHDGCLWVGTTQGGVGRIDSPTASEPTARVYTTKDGLSSDHVTSITEDESGRIYVGTDRGLDRLDVETGGIEHYTTADGLANSYVNVLLTDKWGQVWVGTLQGLSLLRPRPRSRVSPPAVFITGLRVDGVRQRVSDLGVHEIQRVVSSAGQVEIEYSGVDDLLGGRLSFSYVLDPVDRTLSEPGIARSVTYAHLAPGDYRFSVVASNAVGKTSGRAATVEFVVPPPVWRRWWFMTAVGAVVVGLSYTAHRHQIARALELARIRTRIATDLHDDIGAGLSRIAVISDVLNHGRKEKFLQEDHRMLQTIADSARALHEEMGDVVWSVDPKLDDLVSLVRRIREFAFDVLGSKGIEWELSSPPDIETIRLRADLRRQLLLIFKEAINNIVKHADCSSVEMSIAVKERRVVCEIEDNGRGMSAAGGHGDSFESGSGYGLGSMRRRAEELGGHLDIVSVPAKGTRITFEVPV